MTRINVHLDDVQDSSFELFPDGTYLVTIQVSSKLKKSDAGAYIQIISKCDDGEMEDKMIGWNCSLLPNALWNLKNMLSALGQEWDEDGFELEDIFECQIMIDVTSREYPEGSGEYRNQVDAYHTA